MKFHEKLTELRKKHGYTQEALAEKLGVTRQAVSRWESGDTTPELFLLRELCTVFGVSADYLIRDDMKTDTPPIGEPPPTEEKKSASPKKKHSLVAAILFATVWLWNMTVLFSTPRTATTLLIILCFNIAASAGLTTTMLLRYFRQ